MAGETRISDLIQEIKRADLILPEFQRGYVWDRKQVRSYLNSLYRAYPTGSFLIWKTPTPPKLRGRLASEDTTTFRLILDGQQRLTSIYVLLEGEAPPFYEGERLYFNLHFNVLKEEFAYYKASQMRNNREWIPVTSFFKKGLATFLQDVAGLDQETRDFYFGNMPKLTKLERIRDYLYYQKEIVELDMERVVEVFNLVNSSGTRLSKSDLALAHIGSMWPDARQSFREAQSRYAQANFKFDLSFFTRCTAIVATGSALYEPLYRTPIEDVKTAWPKVTESLDYLINVLRGDAYIDSSSVFPSLTVLIPLVCFLAMSDRDHFKSSAETRSFIHWMYAAMMWGRYSGSSETKLQADIEALKADDPPARLRDRLIADRGRIKVDPKDLEGAGTASPFYPMTYVTARRQGAVDWFRGTALYQKAMGQSFGLENHHIFPQALLYRSGLNASNPADKRRVNDVANLAYLTQHANLGIAASRPAAYLPKVKAKYPDALRQQSVPENPALWEVDRFDDFLAERRKLLARSLNEFMDSMLRPEERHGLSIGDFIARGEGPAVEFKSSVRWDRNLHAVNKELEKVIAKTLAGFMNRVGGTLLVGVADGGSILGLDEDIASLTHRPNQDGLALHVGNILGKYLGEPVAATVDMSFAAADGQTTLVLSVERALQAVFFEDQAGPEFYVRSGSSTKQLNVKDATDYIKSNWPPA